MHRQRHPFHLVKSSPWPFYISICLFFLVIAFVRYLHFLASFKTVMFLFVCFLFLLCSWFLDIITEATILGFHTRAVQRGIRMGVVLFIVSEIMFFFAFFWAFFHSSLSPSIQIGCIWPPAGIEPFSPWGIPLLNTFILLLSGLTITVVHYAIVSGNGDDAHVYYICTLILAVFFTFFQLYEYLHASFDISDGIYGSTFFMLTGLHGVHVVAGTVAILVSFFRTSVFNQFTREHHIGFESSAWYWHFVDVVWLFLFIAVYWWGGVLYIILKHFFCSTFLIEV